MDEMDICPLCFQAGVLTAHHLMMRHHRELRIKAFGGGFHSNCPCGAQYRKLRRLCKHWRSGECMWAKRTLIERALTS